MTARKFRSPEHERAYACFNSWMRRPDQEDRYADLIVALRDHELKDRLKKMLPEVVAAKTERLSEIPAPKRPLLHGLDGLPQWEFNPPNPEHRSTHLEFLADANRYGA